MAVVSLAEASLEREGNGSTEGEDLLEIQFQPAWDADGYIDIVIRIKDAARKAATRPLTLLILFSPAYVEHAAKDVGRLYVQIGVQQYWRKLACGIALRFLATRLD